MINKKRILITFGTRPEAIKMSPLVKEFNQYADLFCVKVCVSAQHRQMLDQVLDVFDIKPDYDLNIMKDNQNLYDITSNILLKMQGILDDFNPDIVFVHGDTTTTSAVALAAFYKKIKIAHIEAGLRTNNLYSPFPEEANRQITSVLASYHFAPTNNSRDNLLKENKDIKNIVVTGNTVIDALFMVLAKIDSDDKLKSKIINGINLKYNLFKKRKYILVTGHRRENFGQGFVNVCEALKEIATKNKHIDIIYPVHLNPNVQKPVNRILSDINNVYLIDPIEYESFLYLMSNAYIIITDSGGIQEEAPSLGKPVLVTRDATERPEAVEYGTVKLVGTNKNYIINQAQKLIDNDEEYKKMSKANNPYGNGKACIAIVKFTINNIF